jgi:hypothetical protein
MKTKLLTSGVIVILLTAYFLDRSRPDPFIYQGEKHTGVSFVGPRNPLDQSSFENVKRINARWVSLMPYGFVGSQDTGLHFIREGEDASEWHQWWGETPDGIKKCLELARKSGFKIMMKPHIWIKKGTYTGDFTLETEEEWNAFERTYAEYILQYARIAEVFHVEVFCIATEMESMVRERPDFFPALIKAVKKVYKGKLTYAENWDCFEDVPFWSQLDYIGIDGYFPLSDKRHPSFAELSKGWRKHIKQMDRFTAEVQKPVLFTEYGYRSCDYSADKPWETDYSLPDNEALQASAYQSLYEEIWQKPWFAGGYLWKWFPDKPEDRPSRDKFCPQHKLAEEIITEYYAKNASEVE